MTPRYSGKSESVFQENYLNEKLVAGAGGSGHPLKYLWRAAMTVVIAWVRTVHDCEELVFVSDSRLSGDGRNFDACPKILSLPRSDCVIAYAGYSGHAFPMILQLQRSIDSHEPARRGSLDIPTIRTHALKIFDRMAKLIHPSTHIYPEQDVSPEASFVFGGYSWLTFGTRVVAGWQSPRRPVFLSLVASL